MSVETTFTSGIGVLLTEDEIERLEERFARDEDSEYDGSPIDELNDLLKLINEKVGSKLTYAVGGSYYDDDEPKRYAIFSRHWISMSSSMGVAETREISAMGRVDDRDRRGLDEVLWALTPDNQLHISHLGDRLKLVSLLLWH